MRISHRECLPTVDPSVFVAPDAILAGRVEILAESSVWFGAVLRGDVEPIRIGRGTNLQDQVVVHVTGGGGPAVVGDGVTVGHRAVLHGCRIHDDTLIGIGAVVLDGAEVGPESIVGAGAVVAPGMVVPPRTLVLGVPARVARSLTSREIADIRDSARGYVKLRLDYLQD